MNGYIAQTWTTGNPLTVVELFAGYGSQRMALERLRRDFPPFDYKVLAIAEIDKFALAAYEAVHGDCPNLGDVTDIRWDEHPELKDLGLLTYSFPCQDISTAGRQRGFDRDSGTRSSLLWECERAVRELRPRFLLMENVAAIMQKKFLPRFKEWQECLADYGYASFISLINSKDFGIPQNRERVFMVSILDPDGSAQYHFPAPYPLEKRIKDVLEADAPESCYLSPKQTDRIPALSEAHRAKGNGFRHKFVSPDRISGTILTKYGQRPTDTYLRLDETNQTD